MAPVIAVIGAGAAGLMAAIHAAGPDRRVLLFERTADGGRKILISGGGRCNILPSVLDERRFVTASSRHSLRNILRGWPLAGQRHFFEKTLALPLVLEQETGKLFPVSNRARDVRDGLLGLARERGVEFLPKTTVADLVPENSRWSIRFAEGKPLLVDAVVAATGGLSVPQTGSDGTGLRMLERLGHTIHPTYPALTPLTIEPNPFRDLAGVSLVVTLRGRWGGERRSATGGFLFTHKGYSGPSILDISDLAVRSRLAGGPPAELHVQWCALDRKSWEERLAPGPQAVATPVRAELPDRLADRLIELADVDGKTPLARLTREARRRLVDILVNCALSWSGDEGYKKAEVTGGGVALGEVDPGTMQSRLNPGLFICGEALDAFGPIGGYNFAWGWATGRLAGLGAANSSRLSYRAGGA